MNLKSFLSVIIFLFFSWVLTTAPGKPSPNLNKTSLNPTPPDINFIKPDLKFGKFPLYFIQNKGQVNKKAAFYAKTSNYTLWLTKEGLIFDSSSPTHHGKPSNFKGKYDRRPGTGIPSSLHHPPGKQKREVSQFLFIGANKNPAVIPLQETGYKVNYFLGSDRAKWCRNLPTSQAVLYENLYQDIDLKIYGIEKQIEYDWIVKPGANPEKIRFAYKNVKSTRIDDEGNLQIETDLGRLIHQRPAAFQRIGHPSGPEAKLGAGPDERIEVKVKFKKIAANTYGFEVDDYDKNHRLIIDPVVLAYSTYLGGSFDDLGVSLALDSSGNVYVTGYTDSIDFPTLNPFQTDGDINDAAYDVFVTKLDPTGGGSGSLVYSTYIGGDDDEEGWGIAVDGGGNAYVTGYTVSTDFPTSNQYQSQGDINDTSSDVFVAKLSAAGNALLYSTYLGGNSGEHGYAIALDSSNNVYLTGYTRSTDFPTLNQYQTQGDINDATADVFITRLDTTQTGANSLIYSTYLGGAAYDEGDGIAVDSSGNAYVTGYTDSTDFPTRNPYQTDADSGFSDVFVTKIATQEAGDDSLVYSTYLGGENEDAGWAIAVDSSGNVYVTGAVTSMDFPVVNPYQSNLEGLCDAFVSKLSATGDTLLYSTYLGGKIGGFLPSIGLEEGYGIAVNTSGNAYVTGYTTNTDFPVKDAYQSSFRGGYFDAFVTKLSPAGDALVYSTFLGGSDDDEGNAIALDSFGTPYITGYTYSMNFPTLNPFAASCQGDSDCFVTKLVEAPTVTTLPVSGVTLTSAESGGTVIENGGAAISARGVCWSTAPQPTVADSLTTDGSGTGPYTSSITGLTPATTYYVRAYATNGVGCTGYGNELTFSTDVTISGTVTNGVNPLEDVVITFSHDNHTENTDAGGTYSYAVPFGTTTTIIPSHAAVTSWNPAWIYLADISADMSHQDFQAMITASFTISGTISSGGSGLANVTMTGLPGNPVTDASGFYSAVVLHDWSGLVTPSLAGYIFTPQAISYANVVSDQLNQNYTAMSGNPVISGTVRSASGAGIPGMALTFSNSGGGVTTDVNGDYFHTVVPGWSGTATPSLNGYFFNPVSLAYVNVITNQTNQNYTALSSDNPVISGVIWTLAGNGLPGVTLRFSNSGGTDTSNYKGGYSHTVISGWSGKVTPAKEGYEFIPVSRSYSGVSGSQGNNDFIAVTVTGESPEILLNRDRLFYGADTRGNCTGSQSILVSNSGNGTLNWTASTDQTWLQCSPSSGSASGILAVSVDASQLPVGTYHGNVILSAAHAVNTPQTVNVTLNVYRSAKEPFGVFATPLEGSTVCSSIPVTGWVLDDIEVQSVKIYREAGTDLAYIGEAVFVEGARPDVELAYPGYPVNYRAGWGYMLLTNFLPHEGNGTFTLHAIAADSEGNSVTLGKKTITVDNANAVKPFGTLDNPGQGEIISGGSYINWGWVLTPKPNTIPSDGSTIDVYVDGVNLGNPQYNIFRKDIATLLPGYNNSDGAVGKFILDTTQYINGVHTIQWFAVDNAGNKDGIGSRYFSIRNTGNTWQSQSSSRGLGSSLNLWSSLPVEPAKPLTAVERTDNKINLLKLIPTTQGKSEIETRELQQIEIRVAGSKSRISGYSIRGNQIRALPIGSTLAGGVFYWSPGPGYCGKYSLLFIVAEAGNFYKKELTVNIKPLFPGKQ